MTDEIEDTDTKVEIAQDILLMPNRRKVCEWLYDAIRREWAGEPYWPERAVFKVDRYPGVNHLRVELHFNSIEQYTDPEKKPRRAPVAFEVPWAEVTGKQYAEWVPAMEAVWRYFVEQNTMRLRQHFSAAIGLRLVQDEQFKAAEARDEARAKGQEA